MSERDPAEANLAKLSALADARYYAWHARAVQPEREELFAALKKQKVSSSRELKPLRIAQEQLVRAARKRISIYRAVAREYARPEMLSVARLDDLRTHIMRSVGVTLSSLRSSTQSFAGAGVSTLGRPVHEPATSHWTAAAFASSQSGLPVCRRAKTPPSVPEAWIRQAHFFQPRRPSSNSPVRESSAWPPSHSVRCRR